MPKVKSFKKTGTGKLVHAKQGRRHFMSKRSRKRNRGLKDENVLDGGDNKKIQKLVPYL